MWIYSEDKYLINLKAPGMAAHTNSINCRKLQLEGNFWKDYRTMCKGEIRVGEELVKGLLLDKFY